MNSIQDRKRPPLDPYWWLETRYQLEVIYIEGDVEAVYRLAYLHSTHPKDRAQEAAA